MTLEELKEELSKVATDIREIIDQDWATVFAKVESVPYRESTRIMIDVDAAMKESYTRLLWQIRENKEDPEGKRRKYRNAFQKAWMENIANNVGDSYGETIPSQKQVIDYLNRNPE